MSAIRPLDGLTHDALDAEVVRARLKFPGNRLLLAALMEEVGELAKALLQRRPGDEIERAAEKALRLASETLVRQPDAAGDDEHEALTTIAAALATIGGAK